MIETANRLGSHLFEWTHKRIDGTEFLADVLLTRVVRGEQTLPCATVRDITERKRLDDALRRSQERLTLATECARIGIWDWDIAADKLTWDARMYELYGIREQDFSGAYNAWQAALHPDDRAPGDAAIKAAIEGVRDFNIEFRVLWPNGEVHHIEAHALVQGPGKGPATRMIGVNRDITERKRAVETIRLQADQYTTMLATMADGFWILDTRGNFIDANNSYCRMVGYSREELLKLNIRDIEAIETPEEATRHIATIMDGGFDRFESQHRRKDGVATDVEGSVSFWRSGGRFLWFGRDITDRKNVERQLTYSNIVLTATKDSLPEGMIVADMAGKIISHNEQFLKMWRIPRELAEAGIDDAVMRAGAEQLKDPEQFIARSFICTNTRKKLSALK